MIGDIVHYTSRPYNVGQKSVCVPAIVEVEEPADARNLTIIRTGHLLAVFNVAKGDIGQSGTWHAANHKGQE